MTNDLQITVNLYSLADFGLKLISTEIVSFGNKVPKPSFGCTSAYLNQYNDNNLNFLKSSSLLTSGSLTNPNG